MSEYRIVHDGGNVLGYFVEERKGATWWVRSYCLTKWGARRALRRLLSRQLVVMSVGGPADGDL